MRHIKALLPLSLASLGAAEIVGQWTAWELTRTCFDNGTSCTYHMALDQNPIAKTDLSTCIWDVVSLNPFFKPANQTDFTNVKCGQRLSINGGWSNMGFFTIVTTDTAANAYAFFGFTDEEIRNGKSATPRQRPAYRVGTFNKDERPDLGLGMLKKMKTEKRRPAISLEANQQQSDSSLHKMKSLMKMGKRSSPVLNAKPLEKKQGHFRPESSKRRQSIPSQNHPRNHNQAPATSPDSNPESQPTTDQQTWQIHSLTRLTNPPLNLTTFTFSLLSPGLNTPLANCTITIPSASPTQSWYGQRCDPLLNAYTVGWGYNPDTDSAVMTICRPGTGMAWFGWNAVAGAQQQQQQQNEVRFGDSRREGVHRGVCT
ncbi:hypothetical protein QBC40DRAFT_15964 [Triangularia verruculosa]|uniref:Uncharacterized protein n=1 Tax=Triangularia verruculosa TaxID=2587418 RepID=A0AAN6X810_9PEZI|nr:hypothetical protein QBC40DRAFT_15964 [Triangularia verruculosa]